MQTILLIDSCPLTRECLSAVLRAKGYRVQITSQIAQARTMITKRPPDLIITEIRLPDDNVLNLMRTMKNDPNLNKVKVCLLTQAAAKKPILDAIALGACKVMLKSKFTIVGFIEQVDSILTAPNLAAVSGADASHDSEDQSSTQLRYPLPMPAEDPALALKEIKPIMSRAELKAIIDELPELGTFQESIDQALRAIEAPDTEIDQVADLIKADQTIAIKVMRVASSSVYAREEPTLTLKDAIIRIGLENLREIITEIRIMDTDPGMVKSSDEHSIDLIRFWEHAIAVALCSARISEHVSGIQAETAYTAALLHDIGRLIMQQGIGARYNEAIKYSRSLGVGLEHAEKRLFLSDHTVIAKSVLGGWNIPKEIMSAIAHHHLPVAQIEKTCPKESEFVTIVGLADRIVHALGIGCSGNQTVSPTEDFFELLGDNEQLNIHQLTEGLIESVQALRNKILPSSTEKCVRSGSQQIGSPVFDQSFQPMYISMNKDHDAIGHWVESHRDAVEEGAPIPAPTIAIVHIRHARDRQALADRLKEQLATVARETGSQPLPLLLLSPTGKSGLPDETMSLHPTMHLMTPFSVLHFEQAANKLLTGAVRPLESWATKPAGSGATKKAA